jgi:nitrite reductase/ring-hydroxylating ferredoxin subunit
MAESALSWPRTAISGRALTQAEFEAISKPLGQASQLPARCYSDPNFHAIEVERVFMRNWLPVGRVDQVAKPGDFFTTTRFGEPILIVRDREQKLHALSNVCRHRNFPVAQGAGTCRTNFICPYHGWAYDFTGQLRSAPFMDKTPSFEAKQWHLPRFGIDTWQGFIFINFDANAPLLSPQLRTLDEIIAPLNMTQMRTAPLRSVPWPGNWKATLENFTEAYHQPCVHPKTFEPWAPARLGIYEDVDGPYNLFWLPSKDGSDLPTVLPPITGLPERFRNAFVVVNIFPYFHFLIDASSAISLDMEITATDLRCSWSVHVPQSTYELPDFDQKRQLLLELLMPTYNEDEAACRTIGAGQRSRFAQQGKYSWMEKSVHQFHSWLAREYARPVTT